MQNLEGNQIVHALHGRMAEHNFNWAGGEA